MKKFWKFGLSAGLAAVLMAGCGGEDAVNEEQNTETPAEPPTEVAETEFPVTLVDALGDEVVIEEEPQTIVSMVPSTTEISYELGLGDKIVGVSDFDNYPAETAEVEKIGGQEFNVEKVISLDPDLVISHESGISTWEGGLQQLRDAGLTVYVVNNETSFEEVYESISIIGQATGATEEADALIDEMQVQVDEITEQAEAIEETKTVFVEVGSQPDIYTTGSGTFIDEMLTMLGAENLAGDQEGWVSMDVEAIVSGNPDVIVSTEGAYIPDAVDLIKQRSGFAEVTAVKEDAVYNIDSDAVTRSGPRLTVGLMELAKSIYPEVFGE